MKKHSPHLTGTTSVVVFDGSYDDFISSSIGSELHNCGDLSESITRTMSDSIVSSNLLNSCEEINLRPFVCLSPRML